MANIKENVFSSNNLENDQERKDKVAESLNILSNDSNRILQDNTSTFCSKTLEYPEKKVGESEKPGPLIKFQGAPLVLPKKTNVNIQNSPKKHRRSTRTTRSLLKKTLIRQGNVSKTITSRNMPQLGTEVFVITEDQVRWHGILSCGPNHEIPDMQKIIYLKKVRNFGTEDRPAEYPMPSVNYNIENVTISVSDICNLFFKKSNKNQSDPTKEFTEEWISRGPGRILELPKKYLKVPDLLTIQDMPNPGSEIFLITNDQYRWHGRVICYDLQTINNVVIDNMIILENVRLFGTEDRITSYSLIPEGKIIFKYKIFCLRIINNIYFKQNLTNSAELSNSKEEHWICKGPCPMPEPIPEYYLTVPDLLNMKDMPNPGTDVFIVTDDECRWQGTVLRHQPQILDNIIRDNIVLTNVHLFGTEDRITDNRIPEIEEVFDEVKLFVSTIKYIYYKKYIYENLNNSSEPTADVYEYWVSKGSGPSTILPAIEFAHSKQINSTNKINQFTEISESIKKLNLVRQKTIQKVENEKKNEPQLSMPPIGTKVFIIKTNQVCWYGTISCYNNTNVIPGLNRHLCLENARNFGTEDRVTNNPHLPSKFILETATIFYSDISNIFYKKISKENLNAYCSSKHNVISEEWISEGPGPILKLPEMYLEVPELLTIKDMPYPGTEVYLITLDERCWHGNVYFSKLQRCANIIFDSITLTNVSLLESQNEIGEETLAPLQVWQRKIFIITNIKKIYLK